MQKHPTHGLPPIKTLWRDKNSKVWSFFCPQCRAARKVSAHPNPANAENFGRVGLCALFFTLVTWSWFSWKGIVSFVPLWVAFEVFHRTRMRGMLACPHCGFDPYLYLSDVKLARQEIEFHWRKKFAHYGVPYPGAKHEKPLPPAPPVPEQSKVELQRDA